MNIFVSVGTTATPAQEAFVRAIEERLRTEGLVPQTVGRTYFTADSPFIGVNKLMGSCKGAVVIALERVHLGTGTERRDSPKAVPLHDIKFATPWNQIEAALAYAQKIPLLVIAEDGVRQDGLLENGFDWYVIKAKLDPAFLSSTEFNGVLASWKQKLTAAPGKTFPVIAPAEMTVGQLVGALKPTQLWALMGSLSALVAGAFTLGAKLFH
ncbi:hypothetical protein [Sphaerotilus sp.]|uniref:hypothetical protein n=1 Tax=Sphaerotilus sp. TaxID=2093942 RepID=UPI00286E7BC6|nr:hypothetical protein [Sphaerotilus sp.]